MDQADGDQCCYDAFHYLWYSFLHQLHCHLLPCLQSNSFWHHGGCVLHLSVCHPASHSGGNCSRKKPCWTTQLSLPHQCSAKTNSREKMVRVKLSGFCSFFISSIRKVTIVYVVVGSWSLLWLSLLVECCHLVPSSLRCTSSSPLSGPTRSTTCTASCCWCSSSWPLSPSVSPSSAHTSY